MVDYKTLTNNGDVIIKYKHDNDLVTIKYTKVYEDTEDEITTVELFIDELKEIVNSVEHDLFEAKENQHD